MLFKLSMKNIQKSMKDYAVYFFTLIIGVSFFYIFNAIETQTVLLDVSSSTREIITFMLNALSGVSVFISFVLGFLIIYASGFLIKRRNKEFGLYLMLGMGKRKISTILLMETILIGLISLAVGLGVGVAISQFMSIIVAKMFEADMTKFEFVFSGKACLKTIIYFGIMYLVVMIFNTVVISKCKLIDLLQASQRTEKIKLKNPWLCVVVFLISAIGLGYAYYTVTGGISKLDSANKIFIAIGLGAVGTFFIFWSLSGLILKVVMSMKNLYFKGLNSFTLRQVSSKGNTMVFSMTIISLMLFITICVLSSSIAITNSMRDSLDQLAPADLQLKKQMNLDESWLDQGFNKKQVATSHLSIQEVYKKEGYHLDSYFKEYISINMYSTDKLTLKDTLGSRTEDIEKQYKSLRYDRKEDIVKISDFNKLAKIYGKDTYSLAEDEYMIVADFDSMVLVRNEGLKNREKITLFGHTLKPRYTECKEGIIDMAASHINTGVIVVPDKVPDDKYISYENLVANYDGQTKEEKKVIEDKINEIKSKEKEYLLPSPTSRIMVVEASVGIGALVTFIGSYLGIIFLISCAAILALKELSESTDNIQRFQMLRKLGADEKMIHKALFAQIGIFFLFPLLVAGIHSIFGIRFCSYILETMVDPHILSSIVITSGVLVVIYGGYFLITYWCSKNIIKGR